MMEIKHYKCTFIALNVNFPSGANSLRAEFLGSELDRVNLVKGRFVYDSFFIPMDWKISQSFHDLPKSLEQQPTTNEGLTANITS